LSVGRTVSVTLLAPSSASVRALCTYLDMFCLTIKTLCAI